MSDRIAVMDGGLIKQCGTPEDIYEHPVGPFVAGFIGVSNLLPGVCENGGVRLAGGVLCDAQIPSDCGGGTEVQQMAVIITAASVVLGVANVIRINLQ